MEEFIASLYHYIYILVIAVITLFYLPQYVQTATLRDKGVAVKNSNAYFLLLVVIIFIGMRPVSNQYFADMSAYDRILRLSANATFSLNWETDNLIFDNFILWFASNNFDRRLFFLSMSVLYFGAMYIGLKRLFPENTKLAFLTYLAGLSTFAYAVNGMKAGVATSVFILALSFKDKKWLCLILILIALGLHHSMIMPAVACIIVYIFKNPKWYYIGWLFCLVMSVFRVQYFQELFAGMADDQGAIYLNATEETTRASIRFRPDFILYSVMPILLGYKYEIKNRQKLSRKFQFLMHFYLITNALWLLCMYASYNNRIAYLSWFVYPIVIIAPYLDKLNKDPLRYFKLARVVKYQLYFTMFMVIVYYGLLSLGR